MLPYRELKMSKIINRCSCGRSFTSSEWRKLAVVGIQEVPPLVRDGAPEEPLELRNCVCGSTRAVGVSDARRSSTVPPPKSS